MQLARYNGERNLWDLVARLYEIKGTGSVERTRQAGEALLRANPHLGDLSHVPEGVVIVVPQLPDSPPTGEVKSPASMTGPLLDEVRRRLEEAHRLLEESLKAQEAETNRTLKLLQSGELQDLVKDSDAKTMLEDIQRATAADLKEATLLQAEQEQVFGQMYVDLDALVKRLG
jgi:hypothetical protein